MLDEAHYWAATQFGAAELGDVRRTGRLVSTMAAIARAPDESLPRQLGSLAGAKAAYRLFDCGAVTREAVMDPHLAQCRAEAARHPIVLMVHDDTTLDFSTHRRLQGAGRVGDDHGTGFLAHSCLAVLPSGETLGLAHQTIWARPPKGVTRPTRESAVWAETIATIGRPPAGSRFVSVADRGADVFEHLESVRDTGWDAVVRAAQDRRLVTGGRSLTALRAARAMGATTALTRHGEAVVCVAWRELELLPPRNGPAGRAPIRVRGVRVWNDTLEWLLLTTRPVESLDQALEIIAWYARRWTVEEFCCAALRVTRLGRPAAGPSSASWSKPIAWCRCSGLWPSSPSACCACAMPPGMTAPPRPPCRRRRSRSSPPSFSSPQQASPPIGTSCAASPAWAASSPASPMGSPAG
jgi:transposase-like protein